jgi:hypothetical protein
VIYADQVLQIISCIVEIDTRERTLNHHGIGSRIEVLVADNRGRPTMGGNKSACSPVNFHIISRSLGRNSDDFIGFRGAESQTERITTC